MIAEFQNRLSHLLGSRWTLAASIFLLLAGAQFASAQTLSQRGRGPRDATWERIQSSGTIVVGVDPSIPPFGEDTPDGPIGLDPSIARAIAERLGVEVRFVLLSFDGLYDSVSLGYVDMVIAALRPDPFRLDTVRYTRPYFDAGQVLVSSTGVATLDDLGARGGTVAVEFASEGDIAARRVEAERQGLRQEQGLSIARYFTAAEALDAARRNEADAALVDRVSVSLYLGEHDAETLVIAPQTIVPDPYVIAVHRHDWRLYQAVENALLAMQTDGTLEQLRQQWLGE